MENKESKLRSKLREAARKVLSTNLPREDVTLRFYENSTDIAFIEKTLDSVLKELEEEFFKSDDEKH